MASNLRYRDYASPVHPMADFLNKQLPIMLQQHRQNKAAKIHERDMAQMRVDGQKEVAQLNNDLSQQRMMTQSKLTDLADRKERALKNLDKMHEDLRAQGIMASEYGRIPDPTDDSKTIVGKLDADAQRNFTFAQEDYNTVEGAIQAGNTELIKINKELSESGAVLGGIMLGRQKAMEIPDFNSDDELNALDVLDYFDVKKEGLDSLDKANKLLSDMSGRDLGLTDLQKKGFDMGFKGAQEVFYKPLETKQKIATAKAHELYYQAAAGYKGTQANIAAGKGLLDPAEEASALNHQLIDSYGDFYEPKHGMEPLSDEFSSLVWNPENFVTTAKEFKASPVEMFKLQTDYVVDNIENILLKVEDMEGGMNPFEGIGEYTDNPLYEYLKTIRDTNDKDTKRVAMDSLAEYLIGADGSEDNIHKVSGMGDPSGDWDVDSFLSAGSNERDKAFLKYQLLHFQHLNNSYDEARGISAPSPADDPFLGGLKEESDILNPSGL